jgi:hypothetical protein
VSFTVTIHNIPDAQLGSLIARINAPKTMKLEVEHVASVLAKSNGKANDRPLRMTGKRPKSGTMVNDALVIFEKIEAVEGIGTVTMGYFKEQLKAKKKQKDLAMRLVTEGFLAYLK